MNDSWRDFARRVLVAAAIAVFVVVLTLLAWQAVRVLLLVFAGVLLAIFLHGLAQGLSRYTGLGEGWALAAVTLGLAALAGAGAWLIAPDVGDQIDQLRQQLPQAAERLTQQLKRWEWGRQILQQARDADQLLGDKDDVLARATGVFSGTLGAMANLFIVLIIGLYLAAEPRLYTEGLVQLTPPRWRQKTGDLLGDLAHTLRWWLIGKLGSMTVVGVLTAVGLWLLDVPLALTLGLLAALLTFIPNIGPILSVVPALLLALLQGPQHALYVALLYLGIQIVESYFLTPMLQRRTVSLPPALTITAQVTMGVWVGGIGLVLATPLTAALLVLVRQLYVGTILQASSGAGSDVAGGS
ncbi:AI-2E family transporter [Azohydromonas australica]|uniref:AI-2E family transporter n=1 Tax=Azohydromonas australica TaxID=364039 RepID=UPI00146AF6D7|nr:AI-2E family transporter [Azohydromonas australica]